MKLEGVVGYGVEGRLDDREMGSRFDLNTLCTFMKF